MKFILLLLITWTLLSCNNSGETTGSLNSEIEKGLRDTVLVKMENKIDKSYETGFYSRSYTYYRIADKDTLDFKIGITEYERDGSVQLRIFHQNPVLFSRALDMINESLSLIEEDFDLNKLSYIHFEPPVLYKDMTTELSKSYETRFGKKTIEYDQLNEFLMDSWLDEKMSAFLKQYNKKTERYGIEKFQLLEKEYYEEYIPNADLRDYPPFSIHGMGITVILNE